MIATCYERHKSLQLKYEKIKILKCNIIGINKQHALANSPVYLHADKQQFSPQHLRL